MVVVGVGAGLGCCRRRRVRGRIVQSPLRLAPFVAPPSKRRASPRSRIRFDEDECVAVLLRLVVMRVQDNPRSQAIRSTPKDRNAFLPSLGYISGWCTWQAPSTN